DRPGLALAPLIELSAGVPGPAAAALFARADPLMVQIKRDGRILTARLLPRLARRVTLLVELALRCPQRLPTALWCAQLLGQLITARITVELVLDTVS